MIQKNGKKSLCSRVGYPDISGSTTRKNTVFYVCRVCLPSLIYFQNGLKGGPGPGLESGSKFWTLYLDFLNHHDCCKINLRNADKRFKVVVVEDFRFERLDAF